MAPRLCAPIPAVFPQLTFLKHYLKKVYVAQIAFGNVCAAKPGAAGDHVHETCTTKVSALRPAFTNVDPQRAGITEIGHRQVAAFKTRVFQQRTAEITALPAFTIVKLAANKLDAGQIGARKVTVNKAAVLDFFAGKTITIEFLIFSTRPITRPCFFIQSLAYLGTSRRCGKPRRHPLGANDEKTEVV